MARYNKTTNFRTALPRYTHKLAAVIFLLLFITGCTFFSTNKEVATDLTTFTFDKENHPFEIFPEYRIVPGDMLDVLFQIRTWLRKENFKLAVDHTIKISFLYAPELNINQNIRPDGTISLPYLGSVYVLDKSVDDIRDELKGLYKGILNIPEILVEVPDFRSSIKELKRDLHTDPRGLSRLVTVRPDGHVTFPMVGDVMVASKTIPEVNRFLNEKYDKFLPGLHCDLFLEKHAGSLIYVVGQVKRSGGYKISKPVTILEALSMAGGHLHGARLSSVFIVRRYQEKMVATRVNLRKLLTFQGDTKFFFLKPNDIVYVPKTWLKKAAEVAEDLADMIFFKGWGITGRFLIDETELNP